MAKRLPHKSAQARWDTFIEHYRVDRHGERAAVAAGFSPRSARQTACDLLKQPYILEKIRDLDRAAFETKRRSVDSTLEEIDVIAHSDIRGLFNPDGSMKHPLEWPDDVARAVASIEVFEEFEGKGDERTFIGMTKRIKLWSKVDGLTLKAKHQKLLVERHEHTHTVDIGPRLARARERAKAKTIEHKE